MPQLAFEDLPGTGIKVADDPEQSQRRNDKQPLEHSTSHTFTSIQKHETQPPGLGLVQLRIYFQHSKVSTLFDAIWRVSISRGMLRLELIVAFRNIDM
jgi:hypothetical protein